MAKHSAESKKRKADDVKEAIESVDLETGWFDVLLDTGDPLPLIVAELCNRAKITSSKLKKARAGLPSFCEVQWTDIAPEFGLPSQVEDLDLFVTPVYLLPPSFHEALYVSTWKVQDVYREKAQHTREAARLRILDPYIVDILALFRGRIIDKPEQAMVATELSSGGDVEHEIFMVNGVLLFVIELKLGMDSENNAAQLFMELYSGAKMNSTAEFQDLRVYGLLTDLTRFEFYSYEPVERRFFLDEAVLVENSRELFGFGMIHITNKLFSVILTAYANGLTAIVSKSQEKGKRGDMEPPGSSPLEQLTTKRTPSGMKPAQQTGMRRSSTTQWELALKLARESIEMFARDYKTTEDIEKNGKAALALLTQSVCMAPRATAFSGSEDTDVPVLAACTVKAWYEQKIKSPEGVPGYHFH